MAAKTDQATTVSENGAKPQKTSLSIPVSVPVDFKQLLEQQAKDRGVTVAQIVRETLAEKFNYTLPAVMPRGPRSVYAGMTPEQKDAAIKAKQREQRDTMKALMAALKAGKINKEQLFAEFGQKSEPAEATA